MLKIVENEQDAKEISPLDELARQGARRMLVTALEAEVEAYIERHQGERDEDGRRLVVRNGKAQARKVTCGAGTLEVRAPRVHTQEIPPQEIPPGYTPGLRGKPDIPERKKPLLRRIQGCHGSGQGPP